MAANGSADVFPMQCAWRIGPDGKRMHLRVGGQGTVEVMGCLEGWSKEQVLTTDNAAKRTQRGLRTVTPWLRTVQQPKGPSIALLDLKTLTRSQLSGSEGLLRPWSPTGVTSCDGR